MLKRELLCTVGLKGNQVSWWNQKKGEQKLLGKGFGLNCDSDKKRRTLKTNLFT